jgi:polyphenol oxidase
MTEAPSGTLRPDWPAPPGVHAIVTTRELPGHSAAPFDRCNLGDRCGDVAEAVAANRAGLIDRLALPSSPHWLRQVHGTAIRTFDGPAATPAEPPEADAAVTRRSGVVLAVLTADCLPVLLCREDGAAVAAVHAGWRGLAAGVVETALATLGEPARLLAWIGPAIGAASYEVGADVREAFVESDAAAEAAFTATRPGHWRCDLAALARRRLHAAGVARVSGGDFDTFADPRFYSYRRQARTGRFASLIWRD